jgi:guanylate kinase
MQKLIIFSAPSGSGKTTIVKHLLETSLPLEFSISATNRKKREGEREGIDYFFLSDKEFRNGIKNDLFIEWEEVYPGRFYGTPKSELERIWGNGKSAVFDIDAKGGMNLKKKFGDKALAVFVKAPSVEIIESRLRNRLTDTEESIRIRLDKINEELKLAQAFDKILINDDLQVALTEAEKIVKDFLLN